MLINSSKFIMAYEKRIKIRNLKSMIQTIIADHSSRRPVSLLFNQFNQLVFWSIVTCWEITKENETAKQLNLKNIDNVSQ